MSDYIFQHEGALRLTVFAVILGVMISAEALWPRKARTQTRARRWATNFLIIIVDTLAVRLLFPVIALGAALYATQNGLGLFNLIALPFWLEVALCVTVLDGLIYLQHVASHHMPALWALHKMHHTDRDIDASTALRFHPIEIILSLLYKMICVILLGAPALAVIIFEITLNGSAIFNHANVRLPRKLDAMLRLIIVTPDMHRVHHSVIASETNSNYGFNLSIWDRLFRTYIAQPESGHDAMTIGLSQHQDSAPSSLSWSLALPFGKGLKRLQSWL